MSAMTDATTLPIAPPKRVIAAGLFGAFATPKPTQPDDAAERQINHDFVDDYIAGTHAHPLWEEGPARQ